MNSVSPDINTLEDQLRIAEQHARYNRRQTLRSASLSIGKTNRVQQSISRHLSRGADYVGKFYSVRFGMDGMFTLSCARYPILRGQVRPSETGRNIRVLLLQLPSVEKKVGSEFFQTKELIGGLEDNPGFHRHDGQPTINQPIHYTPKEFYNRVRLILRGFCIPAVSRGRDTVLTVEDKSVVVKSTEGCHIPLDLTIPLEVLGNSRPSVFKLKQRDDRITEAYLVEILEFAVPSVRLSYYRSILDAEIRALKSELASKCHRHALRSLEESSWALRDAYLLHNPGRIIHLQGEEHFEILLPSHRTLRLSVQNSGHRWSLVGNIDVSPVEYIRPLPTSEILGIDTSIQQTFSQLFLKILTCAAAERRLQAADPAAQQPDQPDQPNY